LFQKLVSKVIFITTYGIISAKESAYANEKKKKFSRSQENEVGRGFFF
jgi:hypothetical protein